MSNNTKWDFKNVKKSYHSLHFHAPWACPLMPWKHQVVTGLLHSATTRHSKELTTVQCSLCVSALLFWLAIELKQSQQLIFQRLCVNASVNFDNYLLNDGKTLVLLYLDPDHDNGDNSIYRNENYEKNSGTWFPFSLICHCLCFLIVLTVRRPIALAWAEQPVDIIIVVMITITSPRHQPHCFTSMCLDIATERTSRVSFTCEFRTRVCARGHVCVHAQE